jgi:epoxyqueuosine reductase
VKAIALERGFARVGIAPAASVGDEDARRFRDWLAAGRHGSMAHLARNVEQRLNPGLLVSGARSVICLAASYAPGPADPPPSAPVARYARGRDYHKVLKRRAQVLCDRLRELAPTFAGRAFVDSAPLLERSLAVWSGLGWIGRNRCLVVPGLGSYVFLCEIVCNLELEPDEPAPGGCDDCGACIRACPTGALSEEGLDARRCVSYLTVEHRGPIEPVLAAGMGCRLIGCDACQEACPRNRGVPPGDAALRAARPPLGGATLADVQAWTSGDWDAATRGSAARRATHEMFLRNAAIAMKTLPSEVAGRRGMDILPMCPAGVPPVS